MKQRAGRSIAIGVSCLDEACLASASGVLVAGKRFRLKTANARIPKGGQRTLALKLDPKTLKAIKRRLRRGKKAAAQVVVTAKDAAGNSAVAKRKIKLKC